MRKIVLALFLSLLFVPACKTKSELRREQELEEVKKSLKDVRGEKADVEGTVEELRQEITRLGNVVESEAQGRRRDADEHRNLLNTLSTRIQALEQRVVAEELAVKQAQQAAAEAPKASYEVGKKLFEEGKYDDSADVLRTVAKSMSRTEEGKRSHFLLAEALFANKDYASAALEYGEFRKIYSKDALIPNAIYRQAQAFRAMGKKQEAKLFFQDVIDRHPKSQFASKAKAEIKKIR